LASVADIVPKFITLAVVVAWMPAKPPEIEPELATVAVLAKIPALPPNMEPKFVTTAVAAPMPWSPAEMTPKLMTVASLAAIPTPDPPPADIEPVFVTTALPSLPIPVSTADIVPLFVTTALAWLLTAAAAIGSRDRAGVVDVGGGCRLNAREETENAARAVIRYHGNVGDDAAAGDSQDMAGVVDRGSRRGLDAGKTAGDGAGARVGHLAVLQEDTSSHPGDAPAVSDETNTK
jgi:hypothetical protein